jgi:hypothetical protein
MAALKLIAFGAIPLFTISRRRTRAALHCSPFSQALIAAE